MVLLAGQLRTFSEYLQEVGSELFREAFKAQGVANLSLQQLRYLELIEGKPGMLPGELAARFAVTRPTVSNILRRLEQQGLIRREKSPGDGRSWLLHPTERTRRIFEKRRGMYDKLAAHVMEKLSGAESDALTSLFGKITLVKEDGK